MQHNNGKNSIASWARGCAALCAALALGLALSARPAAAAPFAYVANFSSNTVSVIDTGTNMLVATIPVGTGPAGVAVSPDGTRAYVVNQGSNTVSVIDTASNTVVGTPIVVGTGPTGVAVTPDGTRAYVTNQFSNTVSVIATASNAVVATVTASLPIGVAVTPDGQHVYVTGDGNFVSVIDTASNTVVATVALDGGGGSGTGVAVAPNGAHAYVVVAQTATVAVVDTASNTVGATVSGLGSSPFEVAVTPDGAHLYVPNEGISMIGQPFTVSVIATASNKVVATVVVGTNPFGVAITPDGTRAYVANSGSNNVSVIDTASNTVVGSPISVGNSPQYVAIGTPPKCVPFSAFSAKLAIYLDQNPNTDAFGLLSSFTLGSTSDGIDPVTGPVTLQVGTFNATIPPGSFTRSPLGTYTFIGPVKGVNMEVVIQPRGDKQFAVEVAALGANLAGTANPVTVRLSIGDDCGTAAVNALIF